MTLLARALLQPFIDGFRNRDLRTAVVNLLGVRGAAYVPQPDDRRSGRLQFNGLIDWRRNRISTF